MTAHHIAHEAVTDKLRSDYLRWHPAQVASGDIDPMYPVLRGLADRWGLDAEQRAWLVVCHVIWYHPGSTLAGFKLAPSAADLPDDAEGLAELGLLDLPCETERRGHRPKQPLINHLLDLRRRFADEGVWNWAQRVVSGADSPTDAWLVLNDALMSIVGNGRWASYKTAEMLQKVCDLPIVAADAGHRYSSGPRKGLELLVPNCPTGQTESEIDTLDTITGVWADALGEPDIAQVETSLCDFNSLVRGRYYLGHDIDAMLGAWRHPLVTDSIPLEAWETRGEVFEERFLGEYGGWTGVRKTANKHYMQTGVLRLELA